MRDTYKFEQVGDKILWYNNDIMLEFSNPSFQASDEYGYVKNTKSIIYFYYNVCIYKHIISDYKEIYDDNGEYIDDEEIWIWEKVIEKHTYDFPTILQLEHILELIIDKKIDVKTTGEKHEYLNGEIEYSRTFCSEGFACDDFYEITKYVRPSNNTSSFIVYIGCSFDVQSDKNSVGIRTPYITYGDLCQLQTCVKKFLKYTIDIHNEDTFSCNKVYMESFYVKNNKLYELAQNYKKRTIKKNQIESIYTIGQKFDDVIYLEYNNDTDYHSNRLRNVTLKEVKENSIVFSNGTEVSINTLLHLSDYSISNSEKIKYGINEIANDFISILDDKEKKEFQKKDIDKLLKKYNMAIINRTWMCRDEHNFPIDYNTGSTVKEVQPIVRQVIEKIKELL